MRRFVKLNDSLHVNPAAIVALQDNGNGSVQVTLARDVVFTVQGTADGIVSAIGDVETENYMREIELANALAPQPVPVQDPAHEPQPGPAAVDLGAGPDALTLGTDQQLPPINPAAGRPYTAEELAQQAAQTQEPAGTGDASPNPSEVNAQATEQAVGQ